MGGCVSRSDACVGVRRKARSGGGGGGGGGGGARRRRRRGIRKRVSSSAAGAVAGRSMETIDEAEAAGGAADHRSHGNPSFPGSIEEAWFDSLALTESDGEDDFHSVQDDVFSLNGFESEAAVSTSLSKDIHSGGGNSNTPFNLSTDQNHRSQKSSEQSKGSLEHGVKPFGGHDDISSLSMDETSSRGEGGILNNCGILPSNCLPCLASTAPITEKKRPLSSSPTNSIKMPSLKLPFKKKAGEGHASATPFSSKPFLERPIAGSQVRLCSVGKKIFDSWSLIEPGSFRVRGANYFRDKKKEFAPNCAAYYPFGVDVFLCQQKINHISRFVELPVPNTTTKFPPLLVVNVQIPLYPASIFQNETDGEGISFVLYFRLAEDYAKELPSHFLDSLRKLIDDEVERVKAFPMDTTLPFRERLKILGRVANLDDLPLSAAERKVMHAYNEKPVLSRPQHEFYLGDGYFEIDLDMHRFSYISRKGFEQFLDRLKLCVIDFGLTIQGNKPEELPEQLLCCVRLNGLDYTNYHQLAVHSS
ncbi:uncharacterized protein LOC109712932 isoform X2 [Ananas comosus]|uniref:Uncharacterized protein LOC109712932 isoform X2 n=1 Tax=Ananas comosus TaxID=4615 RepID=A0A6P5FFW3_ANACO|nr:uncharacterized protein LOC109712932 isoform X2 [Ananas comosus]